jgi:hypothetical protein
MALANIPNQNTIQEVQEYNAILDSVLNIK